MRKHCEARGEERDAAMRMRHTPMDLRVRLLTEPCLWCWDIVDARRGDALVHSSWAMEWMAYESREEALTAGRRRLSELGLPSARRASQQRSVLVDRDADGAIRAPRDADHAIDGGGNGT